MGHVITLKRGRAQVSLREFSPVQTGPREFGPRKVGLRRAEHDLVITTPSIAYFKIQIIASIIRWSG